MAWLGIWFGAFNNCGVWLDGVGQNRETDEKNREVSVEEGFQLATVKFDRDGKGGREVTLGIEYCSINN